MKKRNYRKPVIIAEFITQENSIAAGSGQFLNKSVHVEESWVEDDAIDLDFEWSGN